MSSRVVAATVLCLYCCLSAVFGQQVTPFPAEGLAALPTTDSTVGPYPRFDFAASLSAVLSAYGLPGGAVALISLPTSTEQSALASSLLSPAPLCPFFVNGLSAAGVRRANSATPVSVADAFHHGSNTKAMTALLVNQHVERGRLQWNQTVASLFPYLPWTDGTLQSPFNSTAGYFAGSSYGGSTVIDASWHTVSIQQLLSHTSGILASDARYNTLYTEMYSRESTLDPIALRRINSSNTDPYPVPSRQYFLNRMLSLSVPSPAPSVNSPSPAGYSYANFNYMLAGCVLEEVEGRAWEHAIGDLFAQLGMLSAGFGPPEIDAYDSHADPQQPWPHFYADAAWQPIGLNSPYNAIDNPEALGPAGTVHASLVDWARLTACHLLEGRGESSATAEPAPLLLHPATWSAVHSPFVWPDTGAAVTSYSLSGYVAVPAFPQGWGDTQLTHDGSNNEWYSRSALFLHGEQPFAVLAAFNAAPSNASEAMAALFDAVTGRYTRWLGERNQPTSGERCNTTDSANAHNSSNSPASTDYQAEWNVDTVYFTPITLNETSQLLSMRVYPSFVNAASGAYTVVLALFSRYGVLLGQTEPVSFTTAQFGDTTALAPLEASFPSALYLANDTYYASLWYTHPSGANLFVYAYPTPLIYWVQPGSTFSSVAGNLRGVDVADLLYGAGEWSYAAIVQVSTYSATCAATAFVPASSSTAVPSLSSLSSTAAEQTGSAMRSSTSTALTSALISTTSPTPFVSSLSSTSSSSFPASSLTTSTIASTAALTSSASATSTSSSSAASAVGLAQSSSASSSSGGIERSNANTARTRSGSGVWWSVAVALALCSVFVSSLV